MENKTTNDLKHNNTYKGLFFDGKKYGRLYVKSSYRKNRHLYLKCLCDCGREKDIRADSVLKGTVSCGCYQKEKMSKISKKHGMSKTKIYHVWQTMIQRCENPNTKSYKHYGGRGVTIYQEWLEDFVNFYNWAMENGYSDGLSIDRIDNDKGYFPDNCRWVSKVVQSNNTRRNKYLEYNKEIHTIAEWSRILNIPYYTLQSRIKRGWSIERALSN